MKKGRDFQSVQEIGKIFQSLTEKKVLCGFFLDSTVRLIGAQRGFLYLAGHKDQLWLEASTDNPNAPDEITSRIQSAYKSGKPILDGNRIFAPLIVRSSSLGVAAFVREDNFDEHALDICLGLASQLAGALKNIFLFEENLQMAKLATVGQTVGMVMHEIKNILNLSMLADRFIRMGLDEKNDEYMKEGLKAMKKSLNEMDGFVTDMLSLTRDYELETQKVRLQELFEELTADLSTSATQYKVRLESEVDDKLEPVDADSRALYRSMLNLVKNAIEASKKNNGYVKIRAKSMSADQYMIEVEDNGHGMSDQVKAKLFQAFFSTKGKKGTGLGLLIIRQTVKKHRGLMDVESQEGEGTTFRLTLPKRIA